MEWVKAITDWFTAVVAVAGVLVFPVSLIVGFLKWLPVNIPPAYLPSLAVGIGTIFGAIIAVVVPGAPPLVLCLAAGTVAGYGASESYRVARAASKKLG